MSAAAASPAPSRTGAGPLVVGCRWAFTVLAALPFARPSYAGNCVKASATGPRAGSALCFGRRVLHNASSERLESISGVKPPTIGGPRVRNQSDRMRTNKADCDHEKDLQNADLWEAAEGIRTLDLLHGKQ